MTTLAVVVAYLALVLLVATGVALCIGWLLCIVLRRATQVLSTASDRMARGYLRRFQLCRICFRNMSLQGLLPGVIKASW